MLRVARGPGSKSRVRCAAFARRSRGREQLLLQTTVSSLTLSSPAVWAGVMVAGLVIVRAGWRLTVALRTLPARAWMPRVSRALSRYIGRHEYSEQDLPAADGAPAEWVHKRRASFNTLAVRLQQRFSESGRWREVLVHGLSDLRFTDATRVPFTFADAMRSRFDLCSVVTASQGPRLLSIDGNWTLDVSGSYGVNVAGYDCYKEWIGNGWKRVEELGAVLGPLHPLVAENVAILKSISGLDEVSFHMSGTEAVMAAARLVPFNTRRKLHVCFGGADHGWWDGVQPGLGSERAIDDCLTLNDMSAASLAVIRLRAREIAGVFVNPVQSFHPNTPPPNDAVLLHSGARTASESSDAYT